MRISRKSLGWLLLAPVASVVLLDVYMVSTWRQRPGPTASVQSPIPPPPPVNVESTKWSFDFRGKQVHVDEYAPKSKGRLPAVVCLYGAGGLGTWMEALGHDLASHGYVAIVPNYFDVPGIQSADIPTMDRYFVTWMRVIGKTLDQAAARPEIDPERIGILGGSLGASLALEVGATNPRVACVIDYFGGMASIIGENLERMPPTLILHGEKDVPTPVSRARKLERWFTQKGVIFEIKIYPDQGHGFTGESSADAEARRRRFLDKHLKDRKGNPSYRLGQGKPKPGGRGYIGIVLDESVAGSTRVDEVIPASPVERAGLERGDIIVAIDGVPVKDSAALLSLVRGKKAGDKMTLEIKRGAVQKRLVVNVASAGEGQS
jgi:carboxymethylenebutenolidase